MSIQPIRLFGDPVLTSPAAPVIDFDKEFVIPAGTPIVQVIPFKREKWQMRFGTEDENK